MAFMKAGAKHLHGKLVTIFSDFKVEEKVVYDKNMLVDDIHTKTKVSDSHILKRYRLIGLVLSVKSILGSITTKSCLPFCYAQTMVCEGDEMTELKRCKSFIDLIESGSFNHEGDIHDPNISTTKLIVESFIPQYFPTQRTMLCEGVSATSFYAGLFGITATEESTHYLHIERAKTTIVSHTNESISTCQCAAASIECLIENTYQVNTAASEGDKNA